VAIAVAVAIVTIGRTPPSAGRSLRTGARLYVDCSSPREGDGSAARPWNNLTEPNRIRLGPGTRLLLRRGTACRGSLAPAGSGSAARPIVIGAYGRGRRPRIDTAGLAPDALRLVNDSHVAAQDLELTNHGDDRSVRRGIHIVATAAGTVHDITVRRMYVHDVEGSDVKGLGGSGGIQVDDPASDIVIEDNRIEDVNRSGIWVAGAGRDPRPAASRPWPTASTGIVIADNTVRRVGGDGIVPTGAVGTIVTGNVVCCANLRGRAGSQFDAGIWTFDANGTAIAHNVVYGMANASADGTGYDIDYDQDGTVVESNFGYGNAGGFMLLCTDNEPRHADVRFNLSVGEYAFSETPCGSHPQRAGSLRGVRLYKNTFITTPSRIWRRRSLAKSALPHVVAARAGSS
jgi:hypothetical protein